MKTNLGDEIRDRISGFRGIVTGRTEWLNGCVRVSVQGQVKKGATTIPELQYIDEEQVDVVKPAAFKPPRARASGGPMPHPKRWP